jgi:hypothetical protein
MGSPAATVISEAIASSVKRSSSRYLRDGRTTGREEHLDMFEQSLLQDSAYRRREEENTETVLTIVSWKLQAAQPTRPCRGGPKIFLEVCAGFAFLTFTSRCSDASLRHGSPERDSSSLMTDTAASSVATSRVAECRYRGEERSGISNGSKAIPDRRDVS